MQVVSPDAMGDWSCPACFESEGVPVSCTGCETRPPCKTCALKWIKAGGDGENMSCAACLSGWDHSTLRKNFGSKLDSDAKLKEVVERGVVAGMVAKGDRFRLPVSVLKLAKDQRAVVEGIGARPVPSRIPSFLRTPKHVEAARVVAERNASIAYRNAMAKHEADILGNLENRYAAELSNACSTGFVEEDASVRWGCPVDTCNGRVSEDGRTCDICSTKMCERCMEAVTGDDHSCSEERVATAKVVLSSCKPCPTCAVPIHKTKGCYQMWCTSCRVAFCWRTMRVITTGHIHNPHYLEHRAATGFDATYVAGDVDDPVTTFEDDRIRTMVGNVPVDATRAVPGSFRSNGPRKTLYQRMSGLEHRMSESLRKASRQAVAINGRELPGVESAHAYCRHLVGDITVEDLRRDLRLFEKSRALIADITEVYDYVKLALACVWSMLLHDPTPEALSRAESESLVVAKHANEMLAAVYDRYSRERLLLDTSDWTLRFVSKRRRDDSGAPERDVRSRTDITSDGVATGLPESAASRPA